MFKTILIVLAITIITLIVMAAVDKITTDIAEEGGEVLVVSDPDGIEVTLSGEVELAGTYLLPINSTLMDALKAVALPAVEVHISDISTREDFRHISYASKACIATIAGHGFDGYRMALEKSKEVLTATNC